MIPPELLKSKSLFSLLYKIDQDLCERTRARGCPFAGVRCIAPTTSASLAAAPLILKRLLRFALACAAAVPGCRRRVLPPSVRFWGRRVYWAPVFYWSRPFARAQNPSITLERLKGLCGVWRSTVKRWQRYFRDIFAQSIGYRRLSRAPDAADCTRAAAGSFAGTILPHRRCRPRRRWSTCLQTLALGP